MSGKNGTAVSPKRSSSVLRIIRGAMEIDKDRLSEWLIWIFGEVESIERELLAHRGVLGMLKASGALSDLSQSDLDRALETARQGAAVVLEKKYADIREVIPRVLDRADVDHALGEWLRKWKPEGPAN